MHAAWTASGACTSGSTAPPRGATRRASGGAATTSTTSDERGNQRADEVPLVQADIGVLDAQGGREGARVPRGKRHAAATAPPVVEPAHVGAQVQRERRARVGREVPTERRVVVRAHGQRDVAGDRERLLETLVLD